MPFWSSGLGESLGDSLVTGNGPIWTSGTVWWVNSATGSDAASPAGKERLQPLATLSQAITNAVAEDVIVLMDGHAETIADLAVSKNLVIVGAGQSDGKPTVKLTPGASATVGMLSLAAQVELRNIWVTVPAAATSWPAIQCNSDAKLIGVYQELDENNNTAGVYVLDGGICTIRNSTFVSVATDASDPPAAAVRLIDGVVPLYMDGVVLDGGTVGFQQGAAYSEDASAAAGALYATNMSLLRGADMWLTDTTVGLVQVGASNGGAQIRFGAGIGGPA